MRLSAWLLVSVLLAAGCEEEDPAPPVAQFPFSFEVVADDRPLSDASVMIDRQFVGRTAEDGTLEVLLPGTDGEHRTLEIQPPPGFECRDGSQSIQLRLIERADGRGVATQSVGIDCPPTTRYAAVVIDAGGLSDVPVMHRGDEIARTDDHGFAHVSFQLSAEDRIQLSLDTRAHPRAHPQNPESPQFEMEDRDMLFVFRPWLSEEEERRVRRPPSRPERPRIPVLIPPGRRR